MDYTFREGLVFISPANAAEPNTKNVLVLFTQFHRTQNLWLDDSESTVRSRVPSGVNFFTSHLEYSRLTDDLYLETEAEALRREYQSVKLDLIITVDKPALQLLLKQHDRLFHNTPIVFTAIDPYPSGEGRA
jgi:hypothetical protein